MDTELIVLIVTSLLTLWQEVRHRKDKKAAKPVDVEDALRPTPIKPKKGGKK